MVSALFGIPLYALFLKNAGDHIINILRNIIEQLETKISKRETTEINHMNVKILISAFLLMIAIILIGALGSFAFKWTFFEGLSQFDCIQSEEKRDFRNFLNFSMTYNFSFDLFHCVHLNLLLLCFK